MKTSLLGFLLFAVFACKPKDVNLSATSAKNVMEIIPRKEIIQLKGNPPKESLWHQACKDDRCTITSREKETSWASAVASMSKELEWRAKYLGDFMEALDYVQPFESSPTSKPEQWEKRKRKFTKIQSAIRSASTPQYLVPFKNELAKGAYKARPGLSRDETWPTRYLEMALRSYFDPFGQWPIPFSKISHKWITDMIEDDPEDPTKSAVRILVPGISETIVKSRFADRAATFLSTSGPLNPFQLMQKLKEQKSVSGCLLTFPLNTRGELSFRFFSPARARSTPDYEHELNCGIFSDPSREYEQHRVTSNLKRQGHLTRLSEVHQILGKSFSDVKYSY